MRHDTLVAFLRELELWPLKLTGQNNYVISCLYQESRHANGYDRRPSATISFDQGVSWYRCRACGTRRPFTMAVMERAPYANSTTGWTFVAQKYAALEEAEGAAGGLAGALRPTAAPLRNCTPGLLRLLQATPTYPPVMLEFLAAKGVTAETARSFATAFVPAGHTDEFVSTGPPVDGQPGAPRPVLRDSVFFPTLVYSGGRTVCIGGQARSFERLGSKYFTMYPYAAGPHLYGQQRARLLLRRPFFLVEGGLDVQHLWQERSLGLGVFGLEVTTARALKVRQLEPPYVVVFFDPDKNDTQIPEKAQRLLGEQGVTAHVLRHNKQPKECTTDELRKLLSR